MSVRKDLRCAIYTRVSTDAGLEQDFNSLDAQREAAEAYIRSQAHEGWRLIPTAYDDGGFSGGTLERPGLKRLLQDVRERKIDVIVVYKVDRLTRSLVDFAKLVEQFDQHSTSFVSVTQAFNTTTSMGRLTLNVLLSFAQFEREVTAERIRDKISASKKKGIWVGGNTPFGYRVDNRKLVVDGKEADIVRMIFRRYLELGSLLPLLEELYCSGIRTRKRRLSSGRETGGVPFTRGLINAMLKNRTYVGDLNHKGKSYPGEHAAIVGRELFEAVNARLTGNARESRSVRLRNGYLLQDILYDDRGNRMTPTYSMKNGARYRYYACRLLYEGRGQEAGSVRRVSAPDIENAVTDGIRSSLRIKGTLSDSEQIRSLVTRVSIEPDYLKISMKSSGGETDQQITVPWVPRCARPKREILLPHTDQSKDGRPIRSETRESVVKAVAAGRMWMSELLADTTLTIDKLAEREGRSKRSIQMLLSLNFLSPNIVRALIRGQLPRGIGITRLTCLPQSWRQQHETLGFASYGGQQTGKIAGA